MIEAVTLEECPRSVSPARFDSLTPQAPSLMAQRAGGRPATARTAQPGDVLADESPSLVWQTGPLAGDRVALDRPCLVVGRDPQGCHFLIRLSGISRQHAALKTGARGEVTLIDLNSTNGTFVNGERVWRRELREGDWIEFGREGFVAFSFHAATPRRFPTAAKASE